jgi:threonine synthase
MDIQVSSNFERLLFELNHRDGGMTTEHLQRFRQTGTLSLEPDQFELVTSQFAGHRVDDDETIATMQRVHRTTGHLIDPHTAVGVAAAEARWQDRDVPMITLATAHPAKFPDAVERATGVRPALPAHLADLLERPERTGSVANDLAAVEALVSSLVGS